MVTIWVTAEHTRIVICSTIFFFFFKQVNRVINSFYDCEYDVFQTWNPLITPDPALVVRFIDSFFSFFFNKN